MSGWKTEPEERKSRVSERRKAEVAPEYNGTRETLLEVGGPTLQA